METFTRVDLHFITKSAQNNPICPVPIVSVANLLAFLEYKKEKANHYEISNHVLRNVVSPLNPKVENHNPFNLWFHQYLLFN